MNKKTPLKFFLVNTMSDNSYKYGMCIFGGIGICCFLISVVCLILYITFVDDKKYNYLGELAVYTVLLSFLFFVIRSNIHDEHRNKSINKNKSKSTKVSPSF